jgi:hypothetical protein
MQTRIEVDVRPGFTNISSIETVGDGIEYRADLCSLNTSFSDISSVGASIGIFDIGTVPFPPNFYLQNGHGSSSLYVNGNINSVACCEDCYSGPSFDPTRGMMVSTVLCKYFNNCPRLEQITLNGISC